MDMEKLIKDTFTAHEHDVPDDDRVLAAARQRIDRRRTVSRPLGVAAGVAALSLAAVTVVALNRSADNRQAAGEVTAGGPATVADLSMPFALEWLPPGEVDYLARRIKVGGSMAEPNPPVYSGEYLLTVTTNGQVLNVNVQQYRMTSVDDATFKSGPGIPVTIGGRRGVESPHPDDPGGYELYVAHPDGGTMYLRLSVEFGSTIPTQQLVDQGRRIAENIRFPGTATVTPAFGLRDLPNGTQICAFDVGKPLGPSPLGKEPSTSYQLGTCVTLPPIIVSTNNDSRGNPGEPVQGHQTRYVDENGHHRLWVLDAINDATIQIAGSVPLTDLYDIANRLVLPQ